MFLIVTRNFPPDIGGIQVLMGGLSESLLDHGPVKVFTYEFPNSNLYDSKTKIITALLYMNPEWAQAGGKLRILRSENSLENFAEEVTPQTGTLVAFKRNERSFHGHKTFTGQRRVIQMNWVSTHAANFLEISRHKISAWMKSIFSSI